MVFPRLSLSSLFANLKRINYLFFNMQMVLVVCLIFSFNPFTCLNDYKKNPKQTIKVGGKLKVGGVGKVYI